MTRRFPPSRLLPAVAIFLLALCSPLAAVARDSATVVRVVDGDTLEVSLKGEIEKVRLIGFDTPEKFESDKLGFLE
jgi:endonuclease YncB( thermonuclease family)